MTLVIVVATGIRLETGCTNVCCCTVMLPLDVAAMACICWVTPRRGRADAAHRVGLAG